MGFFGKIKSALRDLSSREQAQDTGSRKQKAVGRTTSISSSRMLVQNPNFRRETSEADDEHYYGAFQHQNRNGETTETATTTTASTFPDAATASAFFLHEDQGNNKDTVRSLRRQSSASSVVTKGREQQRRLLQRRSKAPSQTNSPPAVVIAAPKPLVFCMSTARQQLAAIESSREGSEVGDGLRTPRRVSSCSSLGATSSPTTPSVVSPPRTKGTLTPPAASSQQQQHDGSSPSPLRSATISRCHSTASTTNIFYHHAQLEVHRSGSAPKLFVDKTEPARSAFASTEEMPTAANSPASSPPLPTARPPSKHNGTAAKHQLLTVPSLDNDDEL